MNEAKYVEMMEELVFPALVAKFPDATLIRVQQDGATPHTSKKKSVEKSQQRIS